MKTPKFDGRLSSDQSDITKREGLLVFSDFEGGFLVVFRSLLAILDKPIRFAW